MQSMAEMLLSKAQSFFDMAVTYGPPFIITLSIVVFVHEFGHFWVARRCGVKVLAFSIGMGPEIFGFTDKHGTRWRFSLLPIGGYVQMFGDADPASATIDPEAKAMPEAEKRYAFFAQNVWKRIAIIGAGPGANYLFAFVALFAMFCWFGVPYQPPVIDSTTPGGAAESAGLLPGDKILSIDGERITKFTELQNKTLLNVGGPMQLAVDRKGETKQIAITPKVTDVVDRLGNHVKQPRMGIVSINKTESYEKIGIGRAALESLTYIWEFTRDTVVVLSQMVMGTRSTEDLGGALRIAKYSGDVAKSHDPGWFLEFLIKISLSLGFINLMPIPLLDGGHIFFYLLEALRRRPVSDRFQEYASRFGLGLVLCLMGFTLWNDMVFLKWIPK